jgi:hypothetical protein
MQFTMRAVQVVLPVAGQRRCVQRRVRPAAPRLDVSMSGLSAPANSMLSNGEKTLKGAYPGRTDTTTAKLRQAWQNKGGHGCCFC